MTKKTSSTLPDFREGHRQRLRTEVFANLKGAPDYKVLELLLTFVFVRKDTRPLAHELMRRFGTIRCVLDASSEDLQSVPGLGPRAAELWALLRELQARHVECDVRRGECLCTAGAVAEMARSRLGHIRTEELWAAFVDTQLRLVYWGAVSQGTINAAHVFPQEIIRQALKVHAWGIILVHNHPGGSGPSEHDIAITRRIENAAAALDLCLVEHVILTANNYYGLREEGVLPPLRMGGSL